MLITIEMFHINEIKKASEKLVDMGVIYKEKLKEAENLAAKWGGIVLGYDLRKIFGAENFNLIAVVMASNVVFYNAYHHSLLEKAKKENPGIRERIKSSAKRIPVHEVFKMINADNCNPPNVFLQVRIQKDEALSLLETTGKETKNQPDVAVQQLFSIKDVEELAYKYLPYGIFDEKAMKRARRLAKGYGCIPLYDAVLLFGGPTATILLNELEPPVEGDPQQMEVLEKMKSVAKQTKIKLFVDKEGEPDDILSTLMSAVIGLPRPNMDTIDCLSLSLILAEEEKKIARKEGKESKKAQKAKGTKGKGKDAKDQKANVRCTEVDGIPPGLSIL